MLLSLWPGWNEDWLLYHKCTFDGANRLILINSPETEIDVKRDVYSDWKEWASLRDNTKYEPALRVVGGDPISESRSLGATFFLTNGWRIRPWEGTYELNFVGNLYTEEGSSPFIPTINPSNVSIRLTTSNLVEMIAPVVENLTVDPLAPTPEQVAAAVRTNLTSELTKINQYLSDEKFNLLMELYALYGLDPTKPLVVTAANRTAGTIQQSIVEAPAGTITVTRIP